MAPTVQGEHRSLFEEHAEFCHRNFPNVRISFSIQDSKYDTVSLDNDGLMVREKSGRPHLRPGGHGALLHNLQAANFDLVWIKNVDNIAPQDRHEAINRENLRMLAYYLELEEAVHTSLRKLDEGQVPDIVFLKDKFGISVPAQTNTREFLNRPIRVCGMVPNQRDPGGGPFWVDAKGTEFRQIVELSQINTRSQDQRSKVAKSTHFNPVDMICGVRDYQGRPFNLSDFANPDRYIVSRKTYDGRPIFVLEWPGLWNGQMEKWMTVFVEVPRFVFNPVKTALDLLRPAHQVEEK